MQQIMELLKKQGMDAKTQKQRENMLGGMAQKIAKHQATKLKKAEQKFKAETAGQGMAQVEVEGKQYELKMIVDEFFQAN